MDNMQNVSLHLLILKWILRALNCTVTTRTLRLKRELFLTCGTRQFFFLNMQTMQRCKWSFRTSLHCLVQVTSFIGAERVEGGHNKLPIKGAAGQQPLSFFGVTGVSVLYKHLVDTRKTCGKGELLMRYFSNYLSPRRVHQTTLEALSYRQLWNAFFCYFKNNTIAVEYCFIISNSWSETVLNRRPH